ncbi:MAG: hypothetical protein BWY63_00661 [Chloroflexi bacterium ADurb.Bin360]|nr:MAG: hypothetical protein BWY63_00661 [Chloroflexi bacterium ADurb.Bin360]
MHFLLIFEARARAGPFRREEDVEVEFVGLAQEGDFADGIGQLVGQEDHAGQGSVRVILALPGGFGALLIGIGPVEDLFLDELPGGDGAEGRAGEVEVGVGGDGHDLFIEILQAHTLAKLDFFLALGFEELFGVLAPGAVVVFIQDDAIPVGGVDPFVFSLDTAGAAVPAEIILEGAEADDGAPLIRLLVGETARGDELPTRKIHVLLEVGFPGVLDCRFEGEHENLAPTHAFCQVVGCGGFAEAHLGIRHRLDLFGAECEIQGAVFLILQALAQGNDCCLHVLYGARKPFPLGVGDAARAQVAVHVVVGEGGAILTHGGFFEDDAVGGSSGAERGVLLRHTLLHVAGGVAHFEQPRIFGVGIRVGVDGGAGVGARWEEASSHNLAPWKSILRDP